MDALLRVHNLLAGMPLEERRVDKRVALAFVVADMTDGRARRPLPSTDPTVLMSTKPPCGMTSSLSLNFGFWSSYSEAIVSYIVSI